MKQLFIFLFFCSVIQLVKAQGVPQGMQYQAVARNNKGEILANEPVSLKMSLLTQGLTNDVYYVENHNVITNQFGLFTLVIGEGSVENGTFNTIPWSTQNIWLQLSIKSKGQTSFTTISNSKLLAVPYAFYAESATKLSSAQGNANSLGNLNDASCGCKDGLAAMDILYLGNNGVTVNIYSDNKLKPENLLQTFTNVQNGATLTLLPVRDNKLKDKLFFQIVSTTTPVVQISGKCDDATIGQTYGNFSVVSRTDVKNRVTCSVCDVQQNWKVGGNVVATPCNWLGSISNSDLILITNNLPRVKIAADGNTTIITTTQSTTKDNGALIVKGGVGIEKNLNVGGKVNLSGDAQFGGKLHITDQTQSTSTTTGALIVDGGTGIGKNLNVGGTLNITGTTTLNNTLTVDKATILKDKLDVTEATTLGGTLDVTGKARFRDDVTFDKSVSTAGEIKSTSLTIKDDNNSYLATFENTNTAQGDGIKIKLGRNKSTYTVDQPAFSPAESQEMEDFKNLIRCDYQNGNPGAKVSLLSKIAINGAIQDALSIAGIAVAAGNKIVDFINTNLNLPLILPAITIPPFHLLDKIDLTEKINTGLGLPAKLSILKVIDDACDFCVPDGKLPGPTLTLVPALPTLEIPSLDIPALNVFPTTTVMPKLPTIVIPGVPVTDIFDVSFWGIPNICLDDAPNTSPLNNENEFIRFADKEDKKVGSIRGVSVANWALNYLNPKFLYKLRGAFLSSKVDKFHAQYHFKSEIAIALKDYATIGVEYSSGNGDYAEWLERTDKNELISAGDIVGIVGGKITKDLKGAEQVMVVSSNPIILGNMPAEGKNYQGNNIAFMGQVPVKILGPVISGDYIIGQPNTPGYGIAKHPNKMTIDDFKNAVGRSWANDESDEPKMVNTVVGLHNNNFLNIIKELKQSTEARLNALETRMNMPVILKSKLSKRQTLQ